MKKQLLLPALALIALPAIAQNFDYDGWHYSVVDASAKTCITADLPSGSTQEDGYNYLQAGENIIPSTVSYGGEDYTVVGIGYSSFAYGDQRVNGVCSVVLPNTIKSIAQDAFTNCTKLESVTLSSSLETIQDNAFFGCEILGNVTFPETLTSLGAGAFRNCESMTEIILNEGLLTVGNYAFRCQNSSAVETIEISSTVQNIGSGAFRNLQSLNSVTCNATVPPTVSTSAFDSSSVGTSTLYVPAAALADYEASTWGQFEWMEIKTINNGTDTPTEDVIYLIGAPNGWDIDSSNLVLTKANEDSDMYTGTFNIAEGEFMFRFYKALGEWDLNSIGAAASGDNIAISFSSSQGTNTYVGDVYGNSKANFWVENWPGGEIEIWLDLDDYTIRIVTGVVIPEPEVPTLGENLYLVGTPNGWDIEESDFVLSRLDASLNIWEGTFNLPAPADGKLQFRFYSELGDWGNDGQLPSIGATANNDDNVVINNDFENYGTSNVYNGPCVYGKGNWVIENWGGGSITLTVYLEDDDQSVRFRTSETIATTPDEPELAAGYYWVGDYNDWTPSEEYMLEEINEGVYAGCFFLEGDQDGEVQFKITNENKSEWFGCEEFDYFQVTEEGLELEIFSPGQNICIDGFSRGHLSFYFDTNDMILTVEIGNTVGVEAIKAMTGEEVIYNLNGVRVNRDNLTSGIYIINGKKVAVK